MRNEADALQHQLGRNDAVLFSAQSLDVSRENVSRAVGNAVLVHHGDVATAEAITYDHEANTAEASGRVGFNNADVSVEAVHAFWDMEAEITRMGEAHYRIPKRDAHGEASSITYHGVNEDGRRPPTEMQAVTYTSCPPGNHAWLLKANEVDLDHDSGRGSAWNARIESHGIPFFWLPYYSFPIDDRRLTGMLFPAIGSANDTGIDLSVPYYFNIAPNFDATLTPRYIGDRGLVIGSEFRYLEPRFSGELKTEILPNDDLLQGRHRWLVNYSHRQRLARGWSAKLDFRKVSDDDYFEDFSNSLNIAATTFLRSRAAIRGTGTNWRFAAEVDDFQNLETTLPRSREPYRRIPRVTYSVNQPQIGAGIDFALNSEFVYFDRGVGPTGGRLDIETHFSRPWRGEYWYFTPGLSVRHTQYALKNNVNNGIGRTLPALSLDGGLYFERKAGAELLQTLEPRIRYLYIPRDSQSDIPDFDTSDIDFSQSSLYRNNRFSGTDRVGDANQITLGLTTRLLNSDSGRQILTGSIGQIFYFRNRQVQLANKPPATQNSSSVIGELDFRPTDRWLAAINIAYNNHTTVVDNGLARIQYRAGGMVFNAAYRFRQRNRVNQTDFSLLLPIQNSWQVFARWNFSLDDHRTLEQLLGFQYEGCCWIIRLAQRRFLQNREGERRTSLFLQFELKGLGNIGGDVPTLLQRSILGYQPEG